MGILDKIIKKEDNKAKDGSTGAVANDKKNDKGGVKKEIAIKKEIKKTEIEGSEKKPKSKTDSKKKKVAAKENTPIAHFDMIRKPHISEKAFNLGEENKYVFKVSSSANKSEIKKAVENIYRVSVEKVNMLNVHPKTKIYKGRPGQKSGYKKAVVKLKKGESIDVIEGV